MSSKLLSVMVATAFAVSPLAVQADSAPGEQKGDWIVRAGLDGASHGRLAAAKVVLEPAH